MTTKTTTQWTNMGAVAPASQGDPAASAGSRRVYYERNGEYCYRSASWGEHGTGVHDFRDYGEGIGCDEWGQDNGKMYPASEFA